MEGGIAALGAVSLRHSVLMQSSGVLAQNEVRAWGGLQ